MIERDRERERDRDRERERFRNERERSPHGVDRYRPSAGKEENVLQKTNQQTEREKEYLLKY